MAEEIKTAATTQPTSSNMDEGKTTSSASNGTTPPTKGTSKEDGGGGGGGGGGGDLREKDIGKAALALQSLGFVASARGSPNGEGQPTTTDTASGHQGLLPSPRGRSVTTEDQTKTTSPRASSSPSPKKSKSAEASSSSAPPSSSKTTSQNAKPGSSSSSGTRTENSSSKQQHGDSIPFDGDPTVDDVKSGQRGAGFNNWPGNKHFRALIKSRAREYNEFNSGKLADEVMEDMLGGGRRFLHLSKGQWVQLTRDRVKIKVQQAFRDAKIKVKKEDDMNAFKTRGSGGGGATGTASTPSSSSSSAAIPPLNHVRHEQTPAMAAASAAAIGSPKLERRKTPGEGSSMRLMPKSSSLNSPTNKSSYSSYIDVPSSLPFVPGDGGAGNNRGGMGGGGGAPPGFRPSEWDSNKIKIERGGSPTFGQPPSSRNGSTVGGRPVVKQEHQSSLVVPPGSGSTTGSVESVTTAEQAQIVKDRMSAEEEAEYARGEERRWKDQMRVEKMRIEGERRRAEEEAERARMKEKLWLEKKAAEEKYFEEMRRQAEAKADRARAEEKRWFSENNPSHHHHLNQGVKVVSDSPDDSSKIVDDYTDEDIFIGRTADRKKGNIAFRETIDENMDAYGRTSDRWRFVELIVHRLEVEERRRFLKPTDDLTGWCEVPLAEKLDLVQQAFIELDHRTRRDGLSSFDGADGMNSDAGRERQRKRRVAEARDAEIKRRKMVDSLITGV